MASGNWQITAHRRVNQSTNRINLLPISITERCWNSRTIIPVFLILFFSMFSSVLRWNKSDLAKLINPCVIWANPSQVVPREDENHQGGTTKRGLSMLFKGGATDCRLFQVHGLKWKGRSAAGWNFTSNEKFLDPTIGSYCRLRNSPITNMYFVNGLILEECFFILIVLDIVHYIK